MRLTRIIVFSNNVRRLADFYRTRFGMSVVGTSEEDWIELDGGGCTLAIHGTSWNTSRKGDTGIKLVFGSRHESSVEG